MYCRGMPFDGLAIQATSAPQATATGYSRVNQTGQYQTGQYQTGQYQTGQYQTGQYQTEQYQTGQYQTGQYQTEQYQTEQYQTEQYQTGRQQQGGSNWAVAAGRCGMGVRRATGSAPTPSGPRGCESNKNNACRAVGAGRL